MSTGCIGSIFHTGEFICIGGSITLGSVMSSLATCGAYAAPEGLSNYNVVIVQNGGIGIEQTSQFVVIRNTAVGVSGSGVIRMGNNNVGIALRAQYAVVSNCAVCSNNGKGILVQADFVRNPPRQCCVTDPQVLLTTNCIVILHKHSLK